MFEFDRAFGGECVKASVHTPSNGCSQCDEHDVVKSIQIAVEDLVHFHQGFLGFLRD